MNFISSTGFSDLVFEGGGRTRPLTVVRNGRARGMRLTVDPRDATVRLTLGKRAPLRPALAWAAGKRAWVEGELARMPAPRPIVPGMRFTVGDEAITLDWNPAYPRTPVFAGPDLIRAKASYAMTERNSLAPAEGRAGERILRVGGPREQFPARVLRFLRSHALQMLEHETRDIAVLHNIAVERVAVGDPKSRWGSCAASGDIRYSWRLILAPGFVRRATVAHEVAHRVHMNHGRAFHALAAELTGFDPAPARAWLRAHGPALHWFGRDG